MLSDESLIFHQSNTKWVRLGCSLMTTLIASPDGVRFLATEDQFLAQIVKSFAQLDPVRSVVDVRGVAPSN